MHEVNKVERAIQQAANSAWNISERVGWPHTHRERFRAIYDGVMDQVSEQASSRGVDVDEVERAYSAIIAGDPHLTSHEDLMARTGMDYHNARLAAAVLSDVGDIHECYDDDWNLHWVRCDEFIRQKCEDRRISVCRYYQMHSDLKEFQDKVIDWYVRRNRRQQQPFNLVDLKEEYVHKLQERHFPGKPVGDEWSRHIAARYLKTAQDSIVRTHNLTY